MESETEPFTQHRQTRAHACVNPEGEIYMHQSSVNGARKMKKNKLCSVFKKYLKILGVVISVCAIAFSLLTIINMQNKNSTIEQVNVEASSNRNRGSEIVAKLIGNKTTARIEPLSDKNHTSGLYGNIASSNRNRGSEIVAKLIGNKTTARIEPLSDKNHTSGLYGNITEETVRQTSDKRRHKRRDHARNSRKEHKRKGNRPIKMTGDQGTGSLLFGKKMILGSNGIYEKDRNHFVNIGMREDKLMQDCHVPRMKRSFPDIDYAFLGYDKFRGYPLADGHDPGFTFPIFDADYSDGKQTADCRYSIPKGFFVAPDVSCVTSFSSKVIKTVKDFHQSLSVNARADLSGFGMAFSASSGYRQASSMLSSGQYVYIISTAHCNNYFSKLQVENPPPFTQDFLHWITKLNTSASNNDDYFDFFATFGTHFAKEMTFGARFSYEHKMKTSYYNEKLEKGVNVAAQASYSSLVRVSGGFSLSVDQRKEASEFSKSTETRTVSVGAAPPANGDVMTWASAVQNNPVPAMYKLEPIENLFNEELMGDLDVDYEAISTKLKSLIPEYYARSMPDEVLNNERVTKTLRVTNGGKSGKWFEAEFCPKGTFAVGFNLKYQDVIDDLDNTALNAVSLQCADKHGNHQQHQQLVQSGEAHRGDWKGDVFCDKKGEVPLFLQRFMLKVQPEMGTQDDTSVNSVMFSCADLFYRKWTQQQLERPIANTKGNYGNWSEECPIGSAVCGLQTRVEGHSEKGDNTALNDVKFFCCV